MNNQSYPHPAHRAYIVKFIPFTSPNAYHVVNVETKITHTMYADLMQAKQVAADLNLMIKRERSLVANKAKRAEAFNLRLVK